MKTIKPTIKQTTILQQQPLLKQGDNLTISGYHPYNFTVVAKDEIKTDDKGYILEVEAKPTVDNIGELKPNTIDDLMNSVIEENNNKEKVDDKYVTFEVTLTKRYYDLYIKKGGDKWLKAKLLGKKK